MKKDCTKYPILFFLQFCILAQDAGPNVSEEGLQIRGLLPLLSTVRALSKVEGLPSGEETTLKSSFLLIYSTVDEEQINPSKVF